MEYLVDTTDPQGNRVVLSKDTWEGHILRKHTEMKDHLESVQKTIEKPDIVSSDKREYKGHRLYIREVNLVSQYAIVYVNSNTIPHEVQSAHFAREIPRYVSKNTFKK